LPVIAELARPNDAATERLGYRSPGPESRMRQGREQGMIVGVVLELLYA
jgi:hypothetical protein